MKKKSVRFVSLMVPPMACSPSPQTPPRTAPRPSAEGSRASHCRSAPSAARRLGNAAQPFPISRQSSCHDLKNGRALADSSPPRERREGPPADCPPPRSHEQGYTDQTTELVFRAHPHGWRMGIFLSGTDALSFRFGFVNSTSIGSSPTFFTPAATPIGFNPTPDPQNPRAALKVAGAGTLPPFRSARYALVESLAQRRPQLRRTVLHVATTPSLHCGNFSDIASANRALATPFPRRSALGQSTRMPRTAPQVPERPCHLTISATNLKNSPFGTGARPFASCVR